MSTSKPLTRSLDIMDVVSAHPSGATMSEVAERLGLPAATVYRIMRSLTELGYLTGEGRNSRYRLGERFLRQYHNSVSARHIVNLVRPTLQHLSDQFGEAAYLNALVVDEIQPICAEFPRAQSARSMIFPGDIFPIHATASGKVLCAFQDGELREKMLARTVLDAYRPNTLSDPLSVRAELARVREQGFATCDDEIDEGVFAVAVPVQVVGRGVLYSLGLTGLKARLPGHRTLEEIVTPLRRSARSLGDILRDIH